MQRQLDASNNRKFGSPTYAFSAEQRRCCALEFPKMLDRDCSVTVDHLEAVSYTHLTLPTKA